MKNHSDNSKPQGQQNSPHEQPTADSASPGVQSKPMITGFLAAEIVQAAGLGQPHLIKWFLERRLLDTDLCGMALCAAAHHGQINIVNLLLKHGGDVRFNNEAPLFWATVGEHLAMIKLLQRHGATATIGTVCWAAIHGKHRCLALLMPGASWTFDDLRDILWHASSASENLVECARFVIRHCSDNYLIECVARWDKSVCENYPNLQTLKLLARQELRFRGRSK